MLFSCDQYSSNLSGLDYRNNETSDAKTRHSETVDILYSSIAVLTCCDSKMQ